MKEIGFKKSRVGDKKVKKEIVGETTKYARKTKELLEESRRKEMERKEMKMENTLK